MHLNLKYFLYRIFLKLCKPSNDKKIHWEPWVCCNVLWPIKFRIIHICRKNIEKLSSATHFYGKKPTNIHFIIKGIWYLKKRNFSIALRSRVYNFSRKIIKCVYPIFMPLNIFYELLIGFVLRKIIVQILELF